MIYVPAVTRIPFDTSKKKNLGYQETEERFPLCFTTPNTMRAICSDKNKINPSLRRTYILYLYAYILTMYMILCCIIRTHRIANICGGVSKFSVIWERATGFLLGI